jgi:hypothetical protein
MYKKGIQVAGRPASRQQVVLFKPYHITKRVSNQTVIEIDERIETFV